MAEKVPSFGNFIIDKWYKFILFLAAVLLILGFFFEPKIPLSKITSFAYGSFVIGLFLWIVDRIAHAWVINDNNSLHTWNIILIILHFTTFALWIGLVLQPLLY